MIDGVKSFIDEIIREYVIVLFLFVVWFFYINKNDIDWVFFFFFNVEYFDD